MADNSKNMLINETNEDGTAEEASASNESKKEGEVKEIKDSLQSTDKEVPQSETLTEEEAYEPRCPICLEQFKNKSYPNVCDHEFCFSCLKRWASTTRNACPLCNQRFVSIIFNVESPKKFDIYVIERSDEPVVINNQSFGYIPILADESRVDLQERTFSVNPPERIIGREIQPLQMMSASQLLLREDPNRIRRFDEPGPSTSTSKTSTERFVKFGYAPNLAAESHVDPPERNIEREIECRQMMYALQRPVRDNPNDIRRFDEPGQSTSTSADNSTETSNHALNESSEIESPGPQDDEECQIVQILNSKREKVPEIIDLCSDDEL